MAGYVFLGVFLLRLLVLFRLTDSPFLLPAQGDMHFYNDWAQRILRGEWTDYRAFYGLPLYAYVLAGLYAIFGLNPFVPGMVQACLDGGTAVLLFLIARGVFTDQQATDPVPRVTRGTTIGLLAAAGWAFYLPAQSYSVILMPTAWLVFVFWFVVWQIVRRTETPRPGWFFVMGLLVGITAMGIATVLFLIPLLVCAAALRRRSDGWALSAPGRIAVAVFVLFAGVGIGTSPAWLHNHFIARDPVFLSAHSGVNLWIGNNPAANGYPRFPPGLRAGQQAMLKDSISGAEAAAGRPLKRSEVSAFWSAKAEAYIAQNPGGWLHLLLVKIGNFWNSYQYDDISVITGLREHGVTFPGFRFGIVAALGVTGVVFAVRRFSGSRWILAAVLLHMLSLLSVFVTERYRLAAVPGLMIFAAFTLWRLWQTVATGQYKGALATTALLVATSFVLSSRRGDAELWALDPYNSGLQAFESGRLEVAERKLRLAYAYVPENAELNFALGNLHFARGERQEAARFYGRTLQLDGRHEGAFNNLGVIALEEERWPAAIMLFTNALTQEPNDPKTRYLLAKAFFGAGEFEPAAREVARALELSPNQAEFLHLDEQIRARGLSGR